MSTVLAITVTAVEGRRDDLVAAFEAILGDTRSFDGNISVEILLSDANQDDVLLFEEWESQDHYAKYKAWRSSSGTSVISSSGLVEGPPQTLVYSRPKSMG